MNCLDCRKAMLVFEFQEVEVDYCVRCRGIWLDAGELERLWGDAAEGKVFLASAKPVAGGCEKRRKCPLCAKKMRKIAGGGDRGIVLDQCRQNHGLWFDRGELERILKADGQGERPRFLGFLKDVFRQT